MPVSQHKLMIGTQSVDMSVWTPTGTAKHAVVVAYGTSGMTAPFDALITNFCASLADAGYMVLLPDYFQATNSQPGLSVVYSDQSLYGQWVDVLVAAATSAQSTIPACKVAFAGFSLGGNLVLNAAMKFPAACVVDYFAPVSRFTLLAMHPNVSITQARVKKLPPTLIHHGKHDLIVLPAQSQQLSDWLTRNNIPNCGLYVDYNCGHPGQPFGTWTDTADKRALARTLTFLKKQLK